MTHRNSLTKALALPCGIQILSWMSNVRWDYRYQLPVYYHHSIMKKPGRGCPKLDKQCQVFISRDFTLPSLCASLCAPLSVRFIISTNSRKRRWPWSARNTISTKETFHRERRTKGSTISTTVGLFWYLRRDTKNKGWRNRPACVRVHGTTEISSRILVMLTDYTPRCTLRNEVTLRWIH